MAALARGGAGSRRTLVFVGDVHGHLDKLKRLLENLKQRLGSRWSTATCIWLGDYVDRGPNSREVLEYLCNLKATGTGHRFLAGNHDLGFGAFLGLVDGPLPSAGDYESWNAGETLWAGPKASELHVQGLRWAATLNGRQDSIFSSAATFSSFGVGYGDREALLRVVSPEVVRFLRELEWGIELREEFGTVLAVHAGLEASPSVGEQMEGLLRKDAHAVWIEPLAGRKNVAQLPQELVERGDCWVVSGHHGRLDIQGKRWIVDSCGGMAELPLVAAVLRGECPEEPPLFVSSEE